ncbi:MAG: hypothetical protein AAFX78_06510 [Cyanobacteria bacterium J06638_20]
MQHRASQSWLMRLVSKVLKYFFLGLAGCALAYIISALFDLPFIAYIVVFVLKHFASRVSVLMIFLVVIAVVAESIQ